VSDGRGRADERQLLSVVNDDCDQCCIPSTHIHKTPTSCADDTQHQRETASTVSIRAIRHSTHTSYHQFGALEPPLLSEAIAAAVPDNMFFKRLQQAESVDL